MRRIRDTLYISTALLGQLTIQENRNYERSEHEHDDLITAMLACKAASYLSPQLQDQIRDCIKDHDPARIGLMHRALERECTVLSDELSRDTHADHWGTAVWTILRPAAEPLALATTGFLVTDLIFRQRMLDVHVDSWDSILPWIRATSIMITIIYGYLLWASPRRDRSRTVTKMLSLLIALCSLLHLIGLVLCALRTGTTADYIHFGFRVNWDTLEVIAPTQDIRIWNQRSKSLRRWKEIHVVHLVPTPTNNLRFSPFLMIKLRYPHR